MRIEAKDRLSLALHAAARRAADRPSLRGLNEILGQMVAAAVATIDGVDAGSVTLYEHGRITTRYATTDHIHRLDESQAALREGPCVTAYEAPPASGVIVVQDLAGAAGEPWPRFAPLAVEAGFRGLMSITLSADGAVRGALNLYAAAPDAFSDDSRALGEMFGIQAGLLLFGHQQGGDLQEAAESRDLTAKARGILMERFAIDDGAAFEMLVQVSQDSGSPLVQVARWVGAGRSDEVRPDHALG